MKTILILLSAIPIFAGIVVANLFGFRRLYKGGEVSIDLETIFNFLAQKHPSFKFEFKKRTWAGAPLNSDGVAIINEKYRLTKSTREISRQLIKLGLSGLWDDHEKLIRWRVKCIRTGYILPPLTMLGVALGFLVARVPMMWGLVIVGSILAICICLLWFSRAVEREAAARITTLLEKTRVFKRLSEEEAIIDSVYAWTWVHVLPGVAISFLMKKGAPELDMRSD